MNTKTIKKRDGKLVSFDKSRIYNAICKAMIAVGDEDKDIAESISNKIEEKYYQGISVEDVERQVVKELFLANLDLVADAYAEYKAQRKLMRAREGEDKLDGKFLTGEFISHYKHRTDPFPTELGKFVYYRTYSRPKPEEQRREYWWETCYRVVEFNLGLQLEAMKRQGIEITPRTITELKKEGERIYDLMYNLKIFPSGRSLWIAGSKASYLYPMSNFNCSFVTIDELHKFSEIFFVLMLGTGVGLSVQKQYVSKLPKINSKIEIIHKSYEAVPARQRKEYTELKLTNNNAIEIEIGDSKFGWAKAIDMFFDILSSKQYNLIEYVFINYNNVRPEGERLKTFGGYASGHNNIKQMFEKINKIFKKKRKLNHLQWQKLKL